jgi:thiamine-phosphate pyrophosphorylase
MTTDSPVIRSEIRERRIQAFKEVDLYPVTGAKHSVGRTTLQIVEQILQAGCKIVQLREKGLSKKDYYLLAQTVRQMTSEILMICNDHLDVALSVGADGVHLGQDDLPLDAARELAPDLLIGASSHSLEQALAAEKAGADYVNIGPIYPTGTKEGAKDFLGPQAIAHIGPGLQIPFTVMGGIKSRHIPELVSAGARHIAVVTAVTAEPDPRGAAEMLRGQILHVNH